MFFGSGFPGGFPGMEPPTRRASSNNSKYYELLCVKQDATQDELKKAHRKLALKHHPDKGGDPQKFQEINAAYDILKDPEKRRIYDQYGEDAIKEGMANGGGGGGGMGDLFDLFGMGGGRRGSAPREKRSDDVVHRMQVSLEELYNGTTKKLSMSRNLPCTTCNSAGTKSGRKYECSTCRGTGTQVQLRPIGPGMVQQIQTRCGACSGAGFNTPAHDKCDKCNGRCLVSDKKTFEVQITPGMRDGSKIVLHGEAGCSEPGLTPGDIILVVSEKPQALFKRIGIDLLMVKKLSLVDALCGTTFSVKHLDDRLVKITTSPGEVIKPDFLKVLPEEGMPVLGRAHKGNLYIQFEVEFPDSLDEAQIAALRGVLPKGDAEPEAMEAEVEEEVTLPPGLMSMEQLQEELKSRHRLSREGNQYDSDSDEDGMPRGQRVQCAQQ